jgi:hypothetical protein
MAGFAPFDKHHRNVVGATLLAGCLHELVAGLLRVCGVVDDPFDLRVRYAAP